jgi:hypothetical protein
MAQTGRAALKVQCPSQKRKLGRLTKMSEARTYSPSVASNEITIFRKMEFEKRSDAESGPSDFAKLSIPLNARKKAAI